MINYDVIIIGGGAAGLACGVRLAENSGLKILIIEAGERAGKKLAATGNGQGNVSNAHISVANYRSGNLAVVEKVACGQQNGEWSEGLDVFGSTFYARDEKGRIYPSGRQASALVDALLRKLNRHGIEILLSTKVMAIKKGFEVTVEDGRKFICKYLVMATGGKAQKQFRTDGSAYKLAESLGHRITPLYPSLVQLKTDTKYTKMLKGIRTECEVTAMINGQAVRTEVGDVIFTEYGVSGNAIFSISPSFSSRCGTLEIDLLREYSVEQVIEALKGRIAEGIPHYELLSGIVHNQIGRAVIKRATAESANNSVNMQKIAETLKKFTIEVTGTLGFDYAQVTHGGVDMRDISDNLESKLVKNLYFAGEILDVDGDCGGYNLHWAFTSAKAVANALLAL